MSHFLARLASRTLGAAAPLRPATPVVTAPDPVGLRWDEQVRGVEVESVVTPAPPARAARIDAPTAIDPASSPAPAAVEAGPRAAVPVSEPAPLVESNVAAEARHASAPPAARIDRVAPPAPAAEPLASSSPALRASAASAPAVIALPALHVALAAPPPVEPDPHRSEPGPLARDDGDAPSPSTIAPRSRPAPRPAPAAPSRPAAARLIVDDAAPVEVLVPGWVPPPVPARTAGVSPVATSASPPLQPAPTRGGDPGARAAAPTTATTVVEVSIGRIEIRMPPARAAATPAATSDGRRPVIGLDEYLRRRETGRVP